MAFLSWLKTVSLSWYASPDFLSAIFGDASLDWTETKIWQILWICTDMLFIFVSVCNAGAMADNYTKNNLGRVMLGCVSQTASVWRERPETMIMRPHVNDNSFDGSQPSSLRCLVFASCTRLSEISTSWGPRVPRWWSRPWSPWRPGGSHRSIRELSRRPVWHLLT